jgi:hypothetical protein
LLKFAISYKASGRKIKSFYLNIWLQNLTYINKQKWGYRRQASET